MSDDVVVIDDDPAMLMLIRETLLMQGLPVTGFRSGQEALASADWSSTRTLVVDWMMPGMNGVEVATWVRDNHPHVRRLLVTASPESLFAKVPDVTELAEVISKTDLPGAMFAALDAAS